MAEITPQAGPARGRGSRRRSKKQSTRVDLTPMVDLGFLLITFFIVTTSWTTPHAVRLNMPADGNQTELGASAALTVVPYASDKIFYYNGDWLTAQRDGSYGITGYGLQDGIGEIIRQKQQAMDRSYKGGRSEMMILIKPMPEASYGNVVSLLDEMLINQVRKYAIVQLTTDEKQTYSLKMP